MAADTSVKFALSDMVGAPIMTGAAGSLIALLDAVLVNGWGVQTATQVVVASGVATATFAANHAAWVNSVVTVAGATPSVLNGEQKIIDVMPNKVLWATTAPDGTATGTITVKMAPAGWSKPFSGTNLAVYRSANLQANGHYLRINDADPKFARVVGYETMTAISTGTGLFPTAAQSNGGGYWYKAVTAGTTAMRWALVADSRMFYFLPVPYTAYEGQDAYRTPQFMYFGDPLNLAPVDPWSTVLGVNPFNNGENGGIYAIYNEQSAFQPRAFLGSGTSVPMYVSSPAAGGQLGVGGPAPNMHSGQMAFQPVFVKTASGSAPWRSQLPGVVVSMQEYPGRVLRPFEPVSFGPNAARKDYLFFGLSTNVAATDPTMESGICIDITGPWR